LAELSEQSLSSILSTQIELAKTHDKSARKNARDKATDYFLGNMDSWVPPEENRSKVVSLDVADTIGQVLPGIMRVFTASGRMVVVEPEAMGDDDNARQATEALNYVFFKDNDGEEVIHSAVWDALKDGNGVLKTFFDDSPVYTTSFHSGLTEDQLTLLLMPNEDGEAPEVIQKDEGTELVTDPMTGQMVEIKTYDVRIKRKKAEGAFVVDCVPGEEFLIDGDATKTEEAAFIAHWQRKTRSQLIEEGFAKDKVMKIPSAAKIMTPEQQARDPAGTNTDAADSSMDIVDYYECFIRIDKDGDGIAELIRACMGGATNGVMLDWEVWEDENPFDDIKCEPIPHRWIARSLADEAMEIQDVKTVLTRQMLNNIYWANNPQRFAKGKIHNPDALDNPVFGQTVFGGPDADIVPLTAPQTGEVALAGLSYADEMLQRRTGVGRQALSLDPDTLTNQSATAANLQHDAQYSQTEQIARSMAMGWRKVFRKLLRLLIKHQDAARTIIVNGKPVTFDPRWWNADMHVSINVGLGTGSRERDLMHLQSVLQSQLMLADRFMAAGAQEDAIDLLPKIIATMVKIAEAAGLRNAEDYYPDYTEEKVAQLKQMAQQAQQKPSPDMMKVQADAQLAQQKHQTDTQITAAKLQADQQANDTKASLEAQRMEREFALRRDQMTAEMALKREQLAAELQLKRELAYAELAQAHELGHANLAIKSNISSNVRPGGQPG